MRKKKELPLTVLKSLEPFVKLKGEKFEIVNPNEDLLKVIDKDVDSDFYFTIEKYKKTDKGTFQFLISRKPRNHNDNGSYQNWIESTSLTASFEVWINLLNEYDSISSFFDNPIAEGFRKEHYSDFDIIDEDADSPLKTNKILILDECLDVIERRLDELVTNQNESQLKEIKTDIFILKENLTTKSKRWIADKLARILAKISMQGPKFIKEFLSESRKQIFKQVFIEGYEFVQGKMIDLLS